MANIGFRLPYTFTSYAQGTRVPSHNHLNIYHHRNVRCENEVYEINDFQRKKTLCAEVFLSHRIEVHVRPCSPLYNDSKIVLTHDKVLTANTPTSMEGTSIVSSPVLEKWFWCRVLICPRLGMVWWKLSKA